MGGGGVVSLGTWGIVGATPAGGGGVDPWDVTWPLKYSVPVAGIVPSRWSGSVKVSGGGSASGRTFLSPTSAVWFPTTIRRIHLRAGVTTARTSSKVKLFRRNGSAWDLVSEQAFVPENLSPLESHIVLSTPWVAQRGDVLGLFLGQNAEISVGDYGVFDTPFDTGDATGTGNTFGSSITQDMHMAAYGDSPFAVFTGDSIFGGHTDWRTPFDTYAVGAITQAPGGDSDFDVSQVVGTSLGFEAANFSRGSQTFAWGVSTGVPLSLQMNPHTLVLGFGVNDVAGGRTWAAVEADLDSIRTLADTAGTPNLMVCEILPWTNGDDTDAGTIRTWNANLATWCAANDAVLIEAHDALGQTRGSTGELDDLNSSYDKDGVHLTAAGVAAYGAVIAAAVTAAVGA